MSFLKRLTGRLSSGKTTASATEAAAAAPSSPAEVLFSRAQGALRGSGARAYARTLALGDARQLVGFGETGLARTLLTEALSEHPAAALRQLLVEVLLARGERGPAGELLKALSLETEHAPGAELALGQLAEDLGDLGAARRHYERALALRPADAAVRDKARRMRARLEGETGLPPEAWQAISRLWGETAAGDRYVVVEEVGRGGAATLFRAREARTGRDVALKVFHPRGDPEMRAQRIRREAVIASRVTGPGVVGVLDVLPERDLMVLPFVSGGSLRGALGRGVLPGPTALLWAAQLARALERVHGLGLVHLDVKPSNVLFDEGRPVLADFGAAGAAELGQVAGTPPYMAPEQTLEGQPGPRADIYGWGVLLLECLTGVASTDPGPLFDDGAGWRRDAGKLVALALRLEPGERPDASQAAAAALLLWHRARKEG